MDKLIQISESNDKSNYSLEEYGKDGTLKTKKSWESSDDFDIVLLDNSLGHKRKFTLGEDYLIEKDLRSVGITVNKNDGINLAELGNIVTEKELKDACCEKLAYDPDITMEEFSKKVRDEKKKELLDSFIITFY